MRISIVAIIFLLAIRPFAFCRPAPEPVNEFRLISINSNFGFLHKGKIVLYAMQKIDPAWKRVYYGGSLIYRYAAANGEFVYLGLTGCPSNIEFMIRQELPNGVDEDFIKTYSVPLLAHCISNEVTSICGQQTISTVQERIAMYYRDKPDRHTDVMEIEGLVPQAIEMPSYAMQGNKWEVLFAIEGGHAEIQMYAFRGELVPFRIVSQSFETLDDKGEMAFYTKERVLQLIRRKNEIKTRLTTFADEQRQPSEPPSQNQ